MTPLNPQTVPADLVTLDVPVPVRRPVRLSGIALPTEHGAWGMVFEALVASLAIAYSMAGTWIALTYIGAFLMRQPMRVLLAEYAAPRRLPQSGPARVFIAIYFLVFAVGCVGTIFSAPLWTLLPLAAATPLAAVQLYFDSERQSRRLAPELAGTIAISSSAAVIALAGGWTGTQAMALWSVLVFRSVPSIMYVRTRLLLEKGKPYSAVLPVAAAAAAVLGAGLLAYIGSTSRLVVLVLGVLFVRAAVGLSRFSKRRKAMQIGILEVIFGTATVLAIILGHYFDL